ncbi:unnamed protein product [Rotaria socialis]|uniref:Uncharacterized protein n=1 Tax=Rotaria socialis TaxID=392032 RepID=A0A819WDT7_9BILA|nr:unnamed protein product [Rotaria socialis]CAF3250307.1 unnamed protein product [Rotaria socialis]CAF3752177.1 unnamed protein product [Rotaria socialis]CAF4121365.1 unnamed protein product [Rotaria socialis]CAF4951814.1 unnamed protein product [Rotaria socialis]
MINNHTAKKPTVSSSFYDSYTSQPVKWYEIVDSYRQYTETYLPIRLENFPSDLWDNLKKFFKTSEPIEVIDDEDPVEETQQTRNDGNIIKLTQYNVKPEKFDSRISDAVRTHSEKVDSFDNRSQIPLGAASGIHTISPPPDRDRDRERRSRRHRHRGQVLPTMDDCPECRAAAAQGFPTMCDCGECRAKRAAYPNRTPYCDCSECRSTYRAN